jgi:hypothetical protein
VLEAKALNGYKNSPMGRAMLASRSRVFTNRLDRYSLAERYYGVSQSHWTTLIFVGLAV